MSALSSVESWGAASGAAGGGVGCAPDIIDLDRYMRGGVRPHARHLQDDRDLLLVDAGGRAASPAPARVQSPSSSSKSSRRRGKHYSHDSGLSDGSDGFERRRHRRPMNESMSGRSRSHDVHGRGRRSRAVNSTDSLRNLKHVYERALKQQQEQIARVTQLCEKLTTSVGDVGEEANCKRGDRPWTVAGRSARGRGPAPTRRASRLPSPEPSNNENESTDYSSSNSSRSTQGKSKKDRHRSAECKTYKIIMTKLDELNRMVAAKRAQPPPPLSASRARRPSPASRSVSVSDKVVATDSPTAAEACVGYALTTTEYRPTVYHAPAPPSSRRASMLERGVGCATHTVSRLATMRMHELDIAPMPPPAPPPAPQPAPSPLQSAQIQRSGFLNVGTESALQCGSEDGSGCSAHAPNCHFDLDDPVHLYSQAKRLPRCPHTPRADGPSLPSAPSPRVGTCIDVHTSESEKSNVHTQRSLCSLCRSYWRTLAGLAAQLFNRPVES